MAEKRKMLVKVVKSAIKRGQRHVCMSYAEREQTRPKCGQSGQGQNGHFHFRIRSFAHYNKILFYYSGGF